MENLSIDQIRTALGHMENNYSLAMDAEEYGLANAFSAKIDYLWTVLVARIRAENPYTTEADQLVNLLGLKKYLTN